MSLGLGRKQRGLQRISLKAQKEQLKIQCSAQRKEMKEKRLGVKLFSRKC
jgi:hypothetical protein